MLRSFARRLFISRKALPVVFTPSEIHLCCVRSFYGGMDESVTISSDGQNKEIREGKAVGVSSDKVFYNPVQEFNRDLSCLVLCVFFERLKSKLDAKHKAKETKARQLINGTKPGNTNPHGGGECEIQEVDPELALPSAEHSSGFKILDVMAASGLRTCRYALEVPHVAQLVANDYDPAAFELIGKNAEVNNVSDRLAVHQQDARELMLKFGFEKNLFHAIDLDPFGTAAPFFEGALQCVADGGLLMVTCTDTAILCGNYPEACYARYGSTSVRNPAHHEISLRIVLNAIACRAMMHEKWIEPLLSVREGHYVRLFLAVHNGAKQAKETVRKTGYIYNCTVCHNFHLQPVCDKSNGYANASITSGNICDVCGTNFKVGGPIWINNIHDAEFVDRLVAELQKVPGRFGTEKVMLGKLGMVQEEMPGRPLYHVAADVFKVVHCKPIPSKQFLSAILNAGYRFSLSHCEQESIKTDAPTDVVWDIIRGWVKVNPVNADRLKDARISRILTQEPKIIANFTAHAEADFSSRRRKLLRFPTLGIRGPMAKPKNQPVVRKGPADSAEPDPKKIRNWLYGERLELRNRGYRVFDA